MLNMIGPSSGVISGVLIHYLCSCLHIPLEKTNNIKERKTPQVLISVFFFPLCYWLRFYLNWHRFCQTYNPSVHIGSAMGVGSRS